MSTKQVLELEDSTGGTLRFEFDGSEIKVVAEDSTHGPVTVDVDQIDRGRVQSFLNACRVEGRS